MEGSNTTGVIQSPTNKVLIVFKKPADDKASNLLIDYTAKVWLPKLSGCYRPLYYDNTSSDATENNVVSQLEPAVLIVSNTSLDSNNGGYDGGTLVYE